MLKDGELIKINEDLCFARATLDKLREDYKAQLIRDGQATPATFKDLTGLVAQIHHSAYGIFRHKQTDGSRGRSPNIEGKKAQESKKCF